MNTHRLWTTTTLCWFFTLFNIERIFPAVNLASYVYCLATLAGVSMLAIPGLRRKPFGVTAVGFGILWIFGKSVLGYSVDLHELPIAFAEVASVVLSQFLCLKVAQNTDEFQVISAQLLNALRANSIAGLRESEPLLLEEIRRARRHERPLSFIALNAEEVTSTALSELVRKLERSLSRDYVMGCISKILDEKTKSHDLTVRIGNQFLILLPETGAESAQLMARRLQSTVESQLGIRIEAATCAFGIDEVTLSGVLDRMKTQFRNAPTTAFEGFEIRPSKLQSQPEFAPSRAN